MASRSLLRRAMALARPFVDQIGYQTAPTGLMTGAESHPAVAVVILVEEQALVPVRIFLKLVVVAEAGSFAVGPAFENRDHAVGSFLGDFMRRDRLVLAAGRRQ